jgi:two-component system CheB/CheR fusion protein
LRRGIAYAALPRGIMHIMQVRVPNLTDPSQQRAKPRPNAPPPPSVPHNEIVIVAVGASAGGLDACRKLLSALPARTGMAFVIVQHLDPSHESLLVELLASRTEMTVVQAEASMPVAPNHVYIIPPGTYLAVQDGLLLVSKPGAPHGARLPFDFLLRSLAASHGTRTVCVVLSGTGADGSLGLQAVQAAGGLIIAEAPEEAEYEGMPRSAIQTGDVDLVLKIQAIPQAIADWVKTGFPAAIAKSDHLTDNGSLAEIIALLRDTSSHDFTLYKPGTLERRIARRMAMATIPERDMAHYLDILRQDRKELDLLTKDLLINVTNFFRDPAVFETLAKDFVPDLVRSHKADQTLRVWVAGCSTGEEAYSLAMLFREEIAAAQLNVKLQIFATDVDADAVAAGRDGLYPLTIEQDVSAARLARFFSKDEGFYRVSQELRASIVFTVQDLLADPPFSRIDMITCRNLMIYLRPEAQAKIVSLFHFSLRTGGLLLLGGAEALPDGNGRFELISKTARLFRHIARNRPTDLAFAMNTTDGVRVSLRAGAGHIPSRHAAVADLCRRLVIENYAPAAVLINAKHEALFTLGPLDRYLRVAPGHPTHDILAMARPGLRTRLRAGVQQAWQDDQRVSVPGGRMIHQLVSVTFGIDIYPVTHDGEKLLLICFVDAPGLATQPAKNAIAPDTGSVPELERELEATRAELRAAIRNLELAGEEQSAINEEAASVNEEYQSTNEELLTSKEELQSLNEELTALNAQLQETLERQRTTANDLQNVLYSTNVATLFLDTKLNIRFFTPATKSLFRVIATDIGRPLQDLKSLAVDPDLLDDARQAMASRLPMEREIRAEDARWYMRRILPYRTLDDGIEGVVITFADITERRLVSQSLDAAKREAENANIAKSRFLAAASHDLRQPLQALTLLQGMLAKTVESDAAKRLVSLLDPTLSAMTSMLNTLLDINQIDAGTVQPKIIDLPVAPLMLRLRDEFAVIAGARGLSLRVVPCHHHVRTDPRLLEQMLRNLLSNAMKYTRHGKILFGCRHQGRLLRLEVWDTGIGIPERELDSIFLEYHQVDNPARERSLGLGLGLSIVKRLGDLLGHRVSVRSRSGRGSVFAIDAMMPPGADFSHTNDDGPTRSMVGLAAKPQPRCVTVLMIEDDPDLRNLLKLVLAAEGHTAITAANGDEALALVARGKVRPDLILADYNLPLAMNGLQLAARLRERLHHHVPVIILTGDISTDVLRQVAAEDCVQMIKPVKPGVLAELIQTLLPAGPLVHAAQPPASAADAARPPVIYVVDDDMAIRSAMRLVLEGAGLDVEDYPSCEAFLDAFHPGRQSCLLIDAYLPGMHGIDLLERLRGAGQLPPSIMITGDSDVGMAVQAMKAGALDLIEKPIGADDLLESVARALELSQDAGKLAAARQTAANQLTALTDRQREILTMILAGQPSKNIAADLGISQRTVENHRAAIMRKTGSRSMPALARLAVTAAWQGRDVEL